MGRLPLTTREGSPAEVAGEYDYWVGRSGRVTNMKRTMLHDLPTYHAFMAWYGLYDRLAAIVGRRAADLYCYAISTNNHCLLCSSFFEQIFVDAGEDTGDFALDETEQLLFDLGSALAAAPNDVPDALFERLKARFDTGQIVLLIGFGAQMVATNYFNMIAKVDVDEVLEPYVTPELLAKIALEG
jgi:alkylhydroperoxidase family enzyme